VAATSTRDAGGNVVIEPDTEESTVHYKGIAAALAVVGLTAAASTAGFGVLRAHGSAFVENDSAGACASQQAFQAGSQDCPAPAPSPEVVTPPASALFDASPATLVAPAQPASATAPSSFAGTNPAGAAVTASGADLPASSSATPSTATPSTATPSTATSAAAAPAGTAVMPDGVPAAQVGSLVLDDSAADIWNTWDHTTLAGADCETPGTFALSSAGLDLTTNGTFGNCAKITSKTTYRYGIFEARIWAQAGPNGTIANWPAFWMVGQNWPVDGEIDGFEAMLGYDSASFHYGADNSYFTKQDTALQPGWNIVDIVWMPQMLAVYYNGQKFVEWDSPDITSEPMVVTFDSTTGTDGYTTGQPSTLTIDYLRIWTAA
jgi:Glycosyl hydrolases family 16